MNSSTSNKNGQTTPPIDNTSVMVPEFQKQLEQALTIVSLEEKIARIKNQARINDSNQKLHRSDHKKTSENNNIEITSEKVIQDMELKKSANHHDHNKSSTSDYNPSRESSDDSDSSAPDITQIIPQNAALKPRTNKKLKAAKKLTSPATTILFIRLNCTLTKAQFPPKN